MATRVCVRDHLLDDTERSMKTPIVWVTATLSAAIAVLTTSFVIATGTRGQSTSFTSSAGQLEIQTVASGLVNPWSLAFLPDGRMLRPNGRGACASSRRTGCYRHR